MLADKYETDIGTRMNATFDVASPTRRLQQRKHGGYCHSQSLHRGRVAIGEGVSMFVRPLAAEGRDVQNSLRRGNCPRRILVTNDDGIDSPGLHHLARRTVGEVTVLAPSSQYSGAGTAIGHLGEPLPDVHRVRLPELLGCRLPL